MKRPTELTREIRDVVSAALEEDLGTGDVTSQALIPPDARGRASIVQKQPGVLFGAEAAREALLQAGAEDFDTLVVEGQWREEVPAVVARASGPARALLAGERVALNLLGLLSGVATITARFVAEVEGSGARILDTRKTIPGLRSLQKAAVAAGGGHNHRFGLHDAILIKENHIAIAGGVAEAINRAKEARPGMKVEVECEDTDQVRAAVRAGAEALLLDNMAPDELRSAVEAARELDGDRRVRLEASGGMTLENVAEIAATGVDEISIGALTHSAPALDVGLDLEPA